MCAHRNFEEISDLDEASSRASTPESEASSKFSYPEIPDSVKDAVPIPRHPRDLGPDASPLDTLRYRRDKLEHSIAFLSNEIFCNAYIYDVAHKQIHEFINAGRCQCQVCVRKAEKAEKEMYDLGKESSSLASERSGFREELKGVLLEIGKLEREEAEAKKAEAAMKLAEGRKAARERAAMKKEVRKAALLASKKAKAGLEVDWDASEVKKEANRGGKKATGVKRKKAARGKGKKGASSKI